MFNLAALIYSYNNLILLDIPFYLFLLLAVFFPHSPEFVLWRLTIKITTHTIQARMLSLDHVQHTK